MACHKYRYFMLTTIECDTNEPVTYESEIWIIFIFRKKDFAEGILHLFFHHPIREEIIKNYKFVLIYETKKREPLFILLVEIKSPCS